jgi:hypothetical protein
MPPSPTGPRYPTVAADGGGGANAWTNTGNVFASDASFATVDIPVAQTTNYLNTTGYGFNIPSTAIIDGIYIEFERKMDTNTQRVATTFTSLLKAGSLAGTPKPGTDLWPDTEAYVAYGGATDLWGITWTPAEINASGFGLAIMADNNLGGVHHVASIDTARITVYWHTAPASVTKTYLYKVYDGAQYLGNLPNVTSEFGFVQDINTAGTHLNIDVGVSADTSNLSTQNITDESGNPLTDESGNFLVTEGTPPIVDVGLSADPPLIKNGNRVYVYEYSHYWPNGKCMFIGVMERWEASYGGEDDGIRILVYSDGQDLDNYIARGSPYVLDQSQTAGANWAFGLGNSGRSGQTFVAGSGVTNIGAITVLLYVYGGDLLVSLSLYDNPTTRTLLASSFVYFSSATTGVDPYQFAFSNSASVTPGSSYYFEVAAVSGSGSLTTYGVDGNPYGNGIAYFYNTPYTDVDFYFQTFSGTGATSAVFNNVDPTVGMLYPIMLDYIARGGLINTYDLDSNSLTLSYTFNTNTIYEAIKAILSISPSTYYWYVDLGTDALYFKNSSTTPDFVFTKGRHLENITITATIENIKNQIYFSGGLTGSTNLYRTYADAESIAAYGVRLDRKSDNRVTLSATADAIGNTEIAKSKAEQYETTITILDGTMDITLLKPGKVIGFNGFGTFVDRLTAQIVSIDYSPSEVRLTLGILPKRLNPEFEKITRGLLAEQTVANPTAPS